MKPDLDLVICVDGGINTVRKDQYRSMYPDQLPDFILPLMVIARGYTVRYETQLIPNEEVADQDSE